MARVSIEILSKLVCASPLHESTYEKLPAAWPCGTVMLSWLTDQMASFMRWELSPCSKPTSSKNSCRKSWHAFARRMATTKCCLLKLAGAALHSDCDHRLS